VQFLTYLEELAQLAATIDHHLFDRAIHLLVKLKGTHNKVIVGGNGGSAAIASHVSVDLTKASGVRCLSIHDPSVLTCFANDFGYDQWLVKAIEYYALAGDVIILISSSGCSDNIVNAGRYAKSRGLCTITFSGFSHNNPLTALGDVNFHAASDSYNIVELTHNIWLCALIDRMSLAQI